MSLTESSSGVKTVAQRPKWAATLTNLRDNVNRQNDGSEETFNILIQRELINGHLLMSSNFNILGGNLSRFDHVWSSV